MSEADSPNNQSGSSAPIEPVELMATIDSATSEVPNPVNDDSWQTIDFPGAMSVDAILQKAAESVEGELIEHEPLAQGMADGLKAVLSQGVIHYSGAEINQATSFAVSATTPDAVTLQQQLEGENAALRDRLAQLELDLVQQQIEWQLESARTQTYTEAADAAGTVESANVNEQPSTFEPTQQHLNQLLQELERSRQTVQRQQILVETLTEQLASSQERIAQLERDCALTQQRHNDQVQQVLQAEGTCRDLRLRLHRQQQQTLQFKAALEKCLEMPTAYGPQFMPDLAIDDSAADPDALSALLQLRHQPVKPWSSPQLAADELTNEPATLPKPLFNLLNGLPVQDDESEGLQGTDASATEQDMPFPGDRLGTTLSTPADPSALLDSDNPEFVTQLMQLIFPDTAKQQVYTTADALQAEPIFDLSPFLEAGDTNVILPIEATNQGGSVSPEQAIESTETIVPLEATEAEGAQQEDTVQLIDRSITNVTASALPDDRSLELLSDNRRDDLTAVIKLPEIVEKTKAATDAEVDTCDGLSGALAQSSANSASDSEGLVPVAARPSQAVSASQGGIPPIFTAPTVEPTPLNAAAGRDGTTDLASVTNNTPIAAWTWRDRLAKASQLPPRSTVSEQASPVQAAQSSADLLALSAVSRQASSPQSTNQQSIGQQSVSTSSHTEPASPSFSTVVPSPIVYPLRSTKKLASLAAVDLPTFPKR